MAEAKSNRKNPAGRPGERREPVSELVPANPLPARQAVIQVALLVGIPLVLLFLIRYALQQFFPSLGY